ncbi:MAG: hypothetical protein HY097_01795 [Nitrospinae bacterium]|nr:hypothetical protein [Nitrospinota bacterium]MBI3813338.1 hypothetical protein [Nitrospinota bacterium]
MIKILLSVAVFIILSSDVFAIEVAPKISDREIVERLTRVEEGIKALQQQIADLKDSTNKQISDLKDGQKALEGRMDTLIYAVLGCFVALMGSFAALMGFVIWDRRTAISPAIRKNKELEEREDKLEKALKEYAFKEPRLAEILRNVGIM